MHNEDKKQFAELVSDCMSMYEKTVTKGMLKIWWAALEQFDLQDVQRAFGKHVATNQFFPKPANIIGIIQGDGETMALQAWDKVFRAVGSVGGYQSVVFDDPAIHASIEELGGWHEVCACPDMKSFEFLGNRFRTLYKSYSNRAGEYNFPPMLRGSHDSHNGQYGIESKPRIIGDKSKALAVMTGGENRKLIDRDKGGDVPTMVAAAKGLKMIKGGKS